MLKCIRFKTSLIKKVLVFRWLHEIIFTEIINTDHAVRKA